MGGGGIRATIGCKTPDSPTPPPDPAGGFLLDLALSSSSPALYMAAAEELTQLLKSITDPGQLFIVQRVQTGHLEMQAVFVLQRTFVDAHRISCFEQLLHQLGVLCSKILADARSRPYESYPTLMMSRSQLGRATMMPSALFNGWKLSGWDTVCQPARGCGGGGAA